MRDPLLYTASDEAEEKLILDLIITKQTRTSAEGFKTNIKVSKALTEENRDRLRALCVVMEIDSYEIINAMIESTFRRPGFFYKHINNK